MVAQGTATTSNSLRKSKLNSARSTNHRPDSQARDANLERRKMTTPYGHVLSKNGYIMVSKLKSSRSGYSHRGYPNQKVDPITARILSANQKRRAIAGNQAGEIKKKNIQLYEEIKSLRILCRNQEEAQRLQREVCQDVRSRRLGRDQVGPGLACPAHQEHRLWLQGIPEARDPGALRLGRVLQG